MTRYGQIGWRMAAMVAAFVGTAALAVILTRVPIGSDAALSSDVTGRACLTSGLEAWLGATWPRASPRTGTRPRITDGTNYTLEFTNVSRLQPLRLSAGVGVRAQRDDQRPEGRRPHGQRSDPETPRPA